MTLFIKVLVLHVEFHLYFSKIRFKKKFSSTYAVHIYNVYISFTESMTEVHTGLDRICNLVCTEITCRRPASRRGARLS